MFTWARQLLKMFVMAQCFYHIWHTCVETL